ncbi:MAG TPA: PepSY domain-containing protein [Nitrososphaeraceae archaeon]
MRPIIMSMIGALILAATLLGGTLALANMQNVSAQMGTVGNMTGAGGSRGGSMMGMMGNQSNITGSIKLSTVFGNALASQIKVSLSQAATTAENTAGNSSHAAAAHFGVVNGYLTYTVWVIDNSYSFHKVIVDAGNGKVLLSQLVSKGGPMMTGHGMMMMHDWGIGGNGKMMMKHGSGSSMHGWKSDGSSHGMMMGGLGMNKP